MQPMAMVRGSSQALRLRGASTTGASETEAKARVWSVTTTAAARVTTEKCRTNGTPRAAAPAPSAAPEKVPMLQPAWKRDMMLRPSSRSTLAPSTFIATSQVPVPRP